MANKARKKNETQLLLALACGATVEQAARQCGMVARTVYRRLDDPEFRRQLQRVRGDMVQRTSGTLTAVASEAVKTLVELMRSPSPFAVRLGAASRILELGMKVRETAELEERLTTLEDRFTETPDR